MTTMTKTVKKPRTVRNKPVAAKATIQVTVDAKTKDRLAKVFKPQGMSPSDAIRMFIKRALDKNDPWYAHNTSSHIPNAATREALMSEVEPMADDELAKIWGAK